MPASQHPPDDGALDRPLTAARGLQWTAALLLLGLPGALGIGALQALASDRAWLLEAPAGSVSYAAALTARPLEVFVLLPLVALGTSLLFLAPGLLLAMGCAQARSGGRWLAAGFALSTLLVSSCAALAQELPAAFASTGLASLDRGAGFALLLLLSTLATGGLTCWRARSGALPAPDRRAVSDLAWCLLPPLALLVVLAPKFLWEDFNGDGAHAFEAARLLLERPLPFWDPEHTDVHEFPGVTSFLFLYPMSWYLRLFGPLEVAARLGYLPFLALLAGVFLWAIERDARRLAPSERCALWAGLFVYSIAMAFSATYSPHNADIALPATQDTYVVAAFVAYALCLRERRLGWACVWLVTTWFAAPNGPLLVMCAVPACLLTGLPIAWRTTCLAVGGVLVGALAARGLVAALELFDLPPPGDEYAGESLASRFKFLILVDWRRFLFALLPAGIVPFAVYFAWPRLERFARFLGLVALASFFVFYVQAGVALHHFVPAMLLPLAAFWRWRATAPPAGQQPARPAWLWSAATLAGALVALALVRPLHAEPRLAAQRLGSSLSERSGDYANSGQRAFGRAELLVELYPFSADPRVPDESYGGSALTWLHYARHERPGAPLDARTNVVLQGPRDPEPEGFTLVAADPSGALWLRDRTLVDAQLAVRQPTPAGSPLFAIERQMLFRQTNAQLDSRVIDVRAVLRKLGL